MRVVDQHRAEQGKTPKTCGHYPSWLHYALLQEGRFDDAKRQLDSCRRMATDQFSSHPDPDRSIVPYYAEMRLFHLIDAGRWDAADAVAIPADRYADARFLLAYGEALAASGGELKAFQAAAARLRERQRELFARIEKKEDLQADRRNAEIVVRQIDALERIREGKKDEGIALLRKAAEAESALPLEFGPPAIQKPTSELLGDELLALGRNAEAEQAYQSTLTRAPGRTRSLQGLLRVQQALGKTEAAARTQGQLGRYVRAAEATR
jgi:hypothetical protein